MLQVKYMTMAMTFMAIVMAITLFIVYSTPIGKSIKDGVEGSFDAFSLSWADRRGLIEDREENIKDAEPESSE